MRLRACSRSCATCRFIQNSALVPSRRPSGMPACAAANVASGRVRPPAASPPARRPRPGRRPYRRRRFGGACRGAWEGRRGGFDASPVRRPVDPSPPYRLRRPPVGPYAPGSGPGSAFRVLALAAGSWLWVRRRGGRERGRVLRARGPGAGVAARLGLCVPGLCVPGRRAFREGVPLPAPSPVRFHARSHRPRLPPSPPPRARFLASCARPRRVRGRRPRDVPTR